MERGAGRWSGWGRSGGGQLDGRGPGEVEVSSGHHVLDDCRGLLTGRHRHVIAAAAAIVATGGGSGGSCGGGGALFVADDGGGVNGFVGAGVTGVTVSAGVAGVAAVIAGITSTGGVVAAGAGAGAAT